MVNQSPNHCAFPWQQMIIDPTGDVTPCCYYHSYSVGRHNASLGNTNANSIEDIWNGPEYSELRRVHVEGVPEGHPCDNCMAYKFNKIYPRFDTGTGVMPEIKHCYIAKLTKQAQEALEASLHPVELWENDRQVASEQSAHEDIREYGSGRFSISGNVVYFSTSDGSDPIVNGRHIELRTGNLVLPIPAFGFDHAAPSALNMKTAYKAYHNGEKNVPARPSLLGFASSADCNIDCGYCSQNQFRAANLQLRNSTHDQVIELTPYLTTLIWAGGEPFFLKPFRDFVDGFDSTSNPNLLFGFTTNGTMTSGKELQKLENRFHRIQASYSIDSFVPETYEELRKGAKFDRVIKNFLSANDRNDGLYWLVQCGILIMKANMHEIDRNIGFAIDNKIELNISPILQYPVTERLDIFTNFETQTTGWSEALDRALALVEAAREEGRLSYDVSGPLRVLRDGLEDCRERYESPLWVEVTISDPHNSLRSMRNPGVIVGSVEDPLGYVEFVDGAGTYRLQIPRSRFTGVQTGRQTEWSFFQDIVEPWMPLETGRLKWGGLKKDILGKIKLQPDKFRFSFRKRNAQLANMGLHTVDGILNTDGSQLHFATRAYELQQLKAARQDGSEDYYAEIDKAHFVHEFGNCYRAPAPPDIPSDQDGLSAIVVLEDGVPLAVSAHDDIRNFGNGRYSLWGDTVFISSSDNSNPQTNGRAYTLESRPEGVRTQFDGPIQRIHHQNDYCYVGFVPPGIPSDQDGLSAIVVLEDGVPLKLGHAYHEDIREKGEGRYSHWGEHIYFSSSDNTDPTSNGRTYTMVEIKKGQD